MYIDCRKTGWRRFVVLLAILWGLGSSVAVYGQCCIPKIQSSTSESGSTQALVSSVSGYNHEQQHRAPDQPGSNHCAPTSQQPKCVDVDVPDGLLLFGQSANGTKKDSDKDFADTIVLTRRAPEFNVRSEPPQRVSILSSPETLYLRYQRFLE